MPQTWNRYAYVINNPLGYIDPSGETIVLTGTEEQQREALKRIEALLGNERMRQIVVDLGKEISGRGMVTELSFISDRDRAQFEAAGDDGVA